MLLESNVRVCPVVCMSEANAMNIMTWKLYIVYSLTTSLTNSRVILHLNKFIHLAWFPSEETNVREAYAILSACKDNKAILDEVSACIINHNYYVYCIYPWILHSRNAGMILIFCIPNFELHSYIVYMYYLVSTHNYCHKVHLGTWCIIFNL